MHSYRIGVDVGGTFTDVVVSGGPAPLYLKVPTRSGAQSDSVREGLKRAARLLDLSPGELLARTERIVHGTTVATNMMIEGTGSRVGLLTTEGFRDELEYRRGLKETIYDPTLPPPRPLVLRRHRHGVHERVTADGAILTPLDENAVRERIRELRDAGCESLAIGFLFSFLNPSHERRAREIAAEEWPEAYLSVSSEILPQVREYERFSTTAVNAYVGPGTARYLDRLERDLAEAGFTGEFLVILSSGGVIFGQFAGRRAASLLLSGPAGGVLAAGEIVAAQTRYDNLITIDMGGTSYDVCLIDGGRAQTTSNTYVERHAVALPMFALHTIGAGGGSIARIDSGGALRVGPASAGAMPGPACYGLGGSEPTVTDANLALGYLNPQATYGGAITLDIEAAREAIRARVAEPLGLSLEEAALGVLRMINAHMTNGIRVVSVQQGRDPRDFALVAFGGNGAVHAGRQAEDLGIDTVLVPRMAGAFSAYGGLFADAQVDHLATWVGRCDCADLASLARVFRELGEKGASVLGGGKELCHETYLACHYAGQTSEIWVPVALGEGAIEQRTLAEAAEAFHREHERERTFAKRDEPVHIIGAKVTSRRPYEKPQRSATAGAQHLPGAGRQGTAAAGDLPAAGPGGTATASASSGSSAEPHGAPVNAGGTSASASAAPPASEGKTSGFTDAGGTPEPASLRNVYFDAERGWTPTPIYSGAQLGPGSRLQGPAIVEEPDATLVVYPGWSCRLGDDDIYILTDERGTR